MIKDFNSFILEGKYVNQTFYHITSFISAIQILKSNTLVIGPTGAISLTRDKNFLKGRGRVIKGVGVMLSLSAEKISNKYKIEPYNYHGLDIEVGDESEERILNRNVENVKNYLTGITIFSVYYPDDTRSSIIIGRLIEKDDPSLEDYVKFIKSSVSVPVQVV